MEYSYSCRYTETLNSKHYKNSNKKINFINYNMNEKKFCNNFHKNCTVDNY